MIDRENLVYIKNILSLNNKDLDLEPIYEILTAVKENDNIKLFDQLLDLSTKEVNNVSQLKNIIIPILHSIKEEDEFLFYSNVLANYNIDTDLLESVLKIIKHNPDLQEDIYDSYSSNQFASKGALLNAIDSLGILEKESTVFIWGCWYGSILIPSLLSKVKKIIALDLDPKAIEIGKKIFGHYQNVEFQCADVFEKYLNSYKDTNLIINTSCEHMPPMKDWKWFGPGALENDTFKGLKGEGFGSPKLSSDCYFAFQSNNMFGIEGHVNCVNSLEEFKSQMPSRARILYEEEVEDTRGTRYMLVGKFMPL
jgi:hypothetical protein